MFIRSENSIRDFMLFYPVVTIIVILNIIIWILSYYIPFSITADGLSIGDMIIFYGIGFSPAIIDGEYWRLVTPIFLHAKGISHVAFNSFSLVLFGPALEQMVGRTKFILAYVVAGIIGNIGTLAIDMIPFFGNTPTLHLGASGAIYGLFGIYLYMIYFRGELIDQRSANIVQTIFLIGLVMTFIQSNINISAHLFGFIGGFIIGPIVLRRAERFSIAKNEWKKAQYYGKKYADDEPIGFDPNRWNKKSRIPQKVRTKLLWIGFFVIVITGIVLSYYAQLN